MSSSTSDWVSLTKSQLADRRLTVKRLMAQENQLCLKEEEHRYKVPDDRRNNQYPCPSEMWEIIFGNLESPEDIQNCYSSCRFFKNLLAPKCYLWLFRKVLPILLNGNYLTVGDVLRCRLVSKYWCRSVENFMQGEDSWYTRETDDLKIKMPFITRANKVKDKILHHPRNPFVSRAVYLDSTNHGELQVLENCGHYIWYLKMSNWISPQADTVYVNTTLSNCPNLTKLELSVNTENYYQAIGFYRSGRGNVNVCANLTSLSIYSEDELKSGVLILQDALLSTFSGQLKELKIEHWNVSYSRHNWPALQTLHLGSSGSKFSQSTTDDRLKSTELLKSLYKLKASKLKNLWIQSAGKNGNKNLELLLQTINRFSQLEELLLQFDWQWEITDEEVMSLPVTLPDVCSVSLKSLHLRTGYSDKITYNLLIYFPHLQFLHIAYGCPGLDSAEHVADVNWIGHAQLRSIRNREMYLKTCDKRLQEVVEIREYMYTRRDEIASSNLWNILPFLRYVTFTDYLQRFDVRIPNKSQVFRRI